MDHFGKEDLTAISTLAIGEGNLLKRQAIKGVFFLGFRRIFIQTIVTAASIVLARLLFPEVFGVFAIAIGFINFMSIFSSLGLEPALIQKKEEPEKEDLQSVFTVSLILSLLTVVITFLLAPLFFRFYQDQLGKQGVFLLQLLSLAIPLQVLKSISGVLLERRLDYFRLMLGEVWEIIVLEATTIILVLLGYGVLSFVWGVILSRLLGFIGFFFLAPWPMGLRFSFERIKGIIGFGTNFQLMTIIGGLNGAIAPIFVGKVSGSGGLGLLNWAGGLAASPRGIPEIFGRLAFPVCARAQDDLKLSRTIIEKSIQLSCFTTFPLITIMAALAFPITVLVYTDKWLGGISAFYFFSFQSIFLVIGGVFTQALLAFGEAKIVRNVTLFWAVLQWVLTIPLVLKFGFTGLAVASALVSSTFFIPLIYLRQKVEFEIARHVWPYLLFSSVSGVAVFFLNQRYPSQRIVDLVLMLGLGGLIYSAQVLLFKRAEIIEDISEVKKILFAQSRKG